MAEHSSIEWTDATWNPITGCSVVSPGCTNCYAMQLAGTRLKHHWSRIDLTVDTKAGPVWNGKVRFNEEWLTQPLQWKRPRMIFVCAHGDLFHPDVPDAWIDRVFAVMALAPQHTFQVLTKRSARMRAYLSSDETAGRLTRALAHGIDGIGTLRVENRSDGLPGFMLPNVWLGVSAEDQTRADERVPDLLATPAAVHFVSAEPLLGHTDYRKIPLPTGALIDALQSRRDTAYVASPAKIDWIIVGGESGPGARPMHPAWARSIRDQCAATSVAFHFKQWGAWASHWEGTHWVSTTGRLRQRGNGVWSSDEPMELVGKKIAGRLLDGVEHNGMPSPR